MTAGAAPSVEVIAVGTELLSGEVLDTDGHFLARTATGLGGRVLSMRIVGDEPGPLAAALRDALARAPRLLLLCGGLGPTPDDGTLAALAEATGRALAEDAAALEHVRAAYEALAAKGWLEDGTLTDSRRKMVRFPAGGRAVPNPAGAAPACVLDVGSTTVVALPGVPEELRAIVEGPLRADLRAILGASVYREDLVLVATNDESAVAPVVAAVAAAFPAVRVKSRARRFGPGVRIRVTLSARGEDDAQVRRLLEDAADAVARECRTRGLPVETTGG